MNFLVMLVAQQVNLAYSLTPNPLLAALLGWAALALGRRCLLGLCAFGQGARHHKALR